jgi:hypothetical protein
MLKLGVRDVAVARLYGHHDDWVSRIFGSKPIHEFPRKPLRVEHGVAERQDVNGSWLMENCTSPHHEGIVDW